MGETVATIVIVAVLFLLAAIIVIGAMAILAR
jgi:hypothetical protein